MRRQQIVLDKWSRMHFCAAGIDAFGSTHRTVMASLAYREKAPFLQKLFCQREMRPDWSALRWSLVYVQRALLCFDVNVHKKELDVIVKFISIHNILKISL
jgi:hypothetical protein